MSNIETGGLTLSYREVLYLPRENFVRSLKGRTLNIIT